MSIGPVLRLFIFSNFVTSHEKSPTLLTSLLMLPVQFFHKQGDKIQTYNSAYKFFQREFHQRCFFGRIKFDCLVCEHQVFQCYAS